MLVKINVNLPSLTRAEFYSLTGKHQDMYSKGHPYPSYPGYIMMTNMNNEPYMNNGSLSPPIPRTVSVFPVPIPRRPPETFSTTLFYLPSRSSGL